MHYYEYMRKIGSLLGSQSGIKKPFDWVGSQTEQAIKLRINGVEGTP